MVRRPAAARKRFGQHFLTDPGILRRIAAAAELSESDTVVEIGPGRGALTRALLETGARVVAVEIDRDLARELQTTLDSPRLRIVQGDVLDHSLAGLAGDDRFVVAGNIPYNITTPIIFQALEAPRPARCVFLVQREVADRLCAPPGGEEYGALTVNLAMLADTERLFRVPAGAFSPPPRVDSTVVRITPLARPMISKSEEQPSRQLVTAAFGLRRKQMRRVVRTIWNLSAREADTVLSSAEILPERRPETLSPQEFARLLRARSQRGVDA